MQRKRRQKLPIMPILAIALALLLTSCASSPEIVTETIAPPPIEWPYFPDPSDRVTVHDDGTVTMDADYWVAIAEYAIDVNATRMIYEDFREIYGE